VLVDELQTGRAFQIRDAAGIPGRPDLRLIAPKIYLANVWHDVTISAAMNDNRLGNSCITPKPIGG
jgi:hypothetical protein